MIPEGYAKQSFRRFAVDINVDALKRDFARIPDEEWNASYWGDIHCSVGMLLLRGGASGGQEDFYCEDVQDHRLLGSLDYIQSLIARDGPFGWARYAFIFRMRPGGVTLVHRDTIDRWHDMYRIHVPIETNPDAFLISSNRSQHFAAGHAWSFDNQTRHGVVNGDQERIHLIFDVDWNDRLRDQVERSDVLAGEHVQRHIDLIHAREKAVPSYFGDPAIRQGIARLRARGLSDSQIVDFFNVKKVPTRAYYDQQWTLERVREIEQGAASETLPG